MMQSFSWFGISGFTTGYSLFRYRDTVPSLTSHSNEPSIIPSTTDSGCCSPVNRAAP